jgi:hypothetical protein
MQLRNIIPISSVVPGAAFIWQTTLKGGRALGAALLKVLHLRDGGMTSQWCSATMSFAKFVVRLQRQGGWRYVVIYLKACKVLLQQAAGGYRIPRTHDLGCAVSRTGSGLPRIIPVVHRRAILSKDIWTIRLWLTFFNLYSVLEFEGVPKFTPIMAPSTMDPDFLREWMTFLNALFPILLGVVGKTGAANSWLRLRRSFRKEETPSFDSEIDHSVTDYVQRLAAWLVPKDWEGLSRNLKPRLIAILKSSPNAAGVSLTDHFTGKARKGPDGKDVKYMHTSTGAVFQDVNVWIDHKLYPLLQEWLKLVDDRVITQLIYAGRKVLYRIRDAQGTHPGKPDGYREWDGSAPASTNESYPLDPSKLTATSYFGFGRSSGELGKLGFKIEPAGKIRVFAMVDYLTQCVMKPVHDLLFNILKSIPQDGTFDQMQPALKLVHDGYKSFWSYDLSAATDRFPVALEQGVMSLILGPRLGAIWVRLLTDRAYIVPNRLPDNRKTPTIRDPSSGSVVNAIYYGAGQPQGALTSWAAFSLSHHILVQYAHYKATGTLVWFTAYALLGDDIVIANAVVAQKYLELLQVIGVEVGLAKSLISSTACFEFAKRTFIGGKDASPISLLAVGVAKADFPVLEQILTRTGDRPLMETLRVSARILGYGYRSLAWMPRVLLSRSRLQGLAILLTRPGSPWGLSVTEWLLQGQPGVVKEVADGTIPIVAESLWTRLQSSMLKSLAAHQSGLKAVLGTGILNPSSTSSEWLDPGNWIRDQFDLYVLYPLVNEIRDDLVDIQARVKALTKPSVDDLNEIWTAIAEIRDALDELPVRPNFFSRTSLKFGAAKRSATLRLWRSIAGLAAKVSARMAIVTDHVTENVFLREPEGQVDTPMQNDASQSARISDPPISSDTDLSLEGDPGDGIAGAVGNDSILGGADTASVDSQSSRPEWETIAQEVGW